MAAMVAADRTLTGARLQEDCSRARDGLGAVTKADMQAAISAVDDWVVANQASFNTALPVAVRTALTTLQKAKLLLYVVQRRYEVNA